MSVLQRRSILRWIPATIMMIVVFLFSACDATQSTATSSPIAQWVLSAYEKLFKELSYKEALLWEDLIHTLVRKAAHLTEYGILSACYLYALNPKKKNKFRCFLAAIILSACYAAGDEFHQTFVPGRSGQLTDVLIDTTGAVIGAGFLWMIAYRKRKEGRTDDATRPCNIT